MSDVRIGSGNYFNTGLVGISYVGVTETQGLPEQQELAPADHAQRPQLDQLLAMPNIESFLEESVRPELEDSDMLTPGKFHQVMESVRTFIGQSVEAMQGNDPEGAKILNRASRLLNEEGDLRALLQMYRTALQQG
ncbi:MAG: hypothetical protein H6R18_406 [Proteobacteria bacterium]|nr:hypothetical protein [Pseudomonadota bacterium]